MAKSDFDFKIRDELKQMPEYKFFKKDFFDVSCSENGENVTLDMAIDMIVYSSKGDKNLAIRDLLASKDFAENCTDFLDDHVNCALLLSYQLLTEIWSQGFLSSMLVLDWGWDEEMFQTSQRVLEGLMNEMDNLILIASPSSARGIWISDKLRQFKDRNSVLNNALKMHLKRESKIKKGVV